MFKKEDAQICFFSAIIAIVSPYIIMLFAIIGEGPGLVETFVLYLSYCLLVLMIISIFLSCFTGFRSLLKKQRTNMATLGLILCYVAVLQIAIIFRIVLVLGQRAI